MGAVLRVTNHAMETIMASNVSQLRTYASSGLFVQRLPSSFTVASAGLVHRPRQWLPPELQTRIWKSWQDGVWTAKQLGTFPNTLPAHSDGRSVKSRASPAIQVECSLTRGLAPLAAAGCSHLLDLCPSASPALQETRAGVRGTRRGFLCRAQFDNADTSDRLPVGLVLPSTEPVREPVTLPQVTEGRPNPSAEMYAVVWTVNEVSVG